MGWTGRFIGLDAILSEVKDEILNEFRSDNFFVKYVSMKFGTAYIALEDKNNNRVDAYIVLWKYSKSNGGLETKVMSECDGPYEARPTAKMLKMLSFIDNEYANKWRIRGWSNFKSMPKEIKDDFIKKGFII